MITAQFLLGWAVRSSILIGLGVLLPRLLRVKNPSIRLAVCIAAVCGSLGMPVIGTAFPTWRVSVIPAAEPSAHLSVPMTVAASHGALQPQPQSTDDIRNIDWRAVGVAIYALVAAWLLLRLATGLLVVRNLRHTSRGTKLESGGVEVRESEHVPSPLTIGIVRPVIVLPADWPEWPREKLDAVLAHESSHVQRRDPAVQFLSAIHRALLWHSPLSWMLHHRIVRLAEEASDDAAVALTRDRAFYAEMVLEFMQRGVRVNWQGVAMARYGCPDDRIDRILDGTAISTGVTRKAAAAIFAIAVPLAYVTAAAVPGRAVREPFGAGTVNRMGTTMRLVSTRMPSTTALLAAAQAPAPPSAKSEQADSTTIRRYLIFLGNTESGSWDSRDPVDRETLRAKFGSRFAWFRQGHSEHVITDPSLLREIEQAMEPQKKVNAAQDHVNQLQSVVNGLQEKVNARQSDVNAEQEKVNAQQEKVNAAQEQMNKRQDLLNRIQSAGENGNNDAVVRELEKLLSELRKAPGAASQDEVNRLQGRVNEIQGNVNELQQTLNQEQGRVNTEQNKVNQEQQKVSEQQQQVSSAFSIRIREIFDSALRRGLTQPVN